MKNQNPNKYPISIAQVNGYLKSKGVEERIARGNGYFYFYGGSAAEWFISGVYVYRVGELTLEGWFHEYKSLSI